MSELLTAKLQRAAYNSSYQKKFDIIFIALNSYISLLNQFLEFAFQTLNQNYFNESVHRAMNQHFLYAELVNVYAQKYDRFFVRNIKYVTISKDKKCIVFIKTPDFSFTRENYPSVFMRYDYPIPPMDFIDALFKLVEVIFEDRSIWTYLQYKERNGAQSCIFDYENCFFRFDDNIFFNTSEEYFLMNKKTYKIPILFCNNFIKNFLNHPLKLMMQPTPLEFKSVFKILKNNVSMKFTHSINEYQGLLQLIINHLQQRHRRLSIIPICKEYIDSPSQTISPNGIPHPKADLKEALDKLEYIFPENIIKFLQNICGDDTSVIAQMAMLIARINFMKGEGSQDAPSCLKPKLTLCLTTNPLYIKASFQSLYGDSCFSVKTTNELCNIVQKGEEYINRKFFGAILQVAEKSTPFEQNRIRVLKKMINGKPLKIKDKAVESLRFISNFQYIIFVASQSDATAYKNSLQNMVELVAFNPTNKRDTLMKEVVMESLPELSPADLIWIHTIFATYGLFLLAGENILDKENIMEAVKSSSNAKKVKNTIDKERNVREFVKKHCDVSPEADCYAEDIYMAYAEYYRNEYGIEPIKRSQFVNILKIDGRFIYKRLRHNRNDNRWGFKGISLKKRREEDSNESPSEEIMSNPKVNLASHLQDIHNAIYPLLVN